MYLESLKTITEKLTIYYDGACPLCLAEIHFLKHHNHKSLLSFVNLHELDASTSELNCDLAMKTIHARLGDNKIITGSRVFQEAYKRQLHAWLDLADNITIKPWRREAARRVLTHLGVPYGQ